MRKILLIVLTLLSLLIDTSIGGGFNCYVGSSTCYEPPCIYKTYVSPQSNDICYRYEVPKCSGCSCEPQCNSTNGSDCYDGCDELSIQNATYTWYYGIETPGQYSSNLCSEYNTNPNAYWRWYRNITCCTTDLCNYPINDAPSNAVSLLGLIVVTIHAMLYIM